MTIFASALLLSAHLNAFHLSETIKKVDFWGGEGSIYICIYIYICVCVCVPLTKKSNKRTHLKTKSIQVCVSKRPQRHHPNL